MLPHLQKAGYAIGDESQYNITLPPKGGSVGLVFDMDEDYLAVRLIIVYPLSYNFKQIPLKYQNNSHWGQPQYTLSDLIHSPMHKR